MIPQMARFLVEKVSEPGQTVLDPFCGSGSVLLEASICGRNTIGIDLNPLAVLLSKVKTEIYDSKLLEVQIEEILKECRLRKNGGVKYKFENANYWFTPATLRKFGILKSVIDEYDPQIDRKYVLFWQAALASIVRACSKADTRGPKPFISKKARAERLGRHFDPFKILEEKARSWIKLRSEYYCKFKGNEVRPSVVVIEGNSINLSDLTNGHEIDAVVTSPPYINAQDYYRSSKLQLFILEHSSHDELRELFRKFAGSDRIHQKISLLDEKLPSTLAESKKVNLKPKQACVFSQYVLDMFEVFKEINQVLKEGLYCSIVSGHNLMSNVKIPTHEVIIELASNSGFQL